MERTLYTSYYSRLRRRKVGSDIYQLTKSSFKHTFIDISLICFCLFTKHFRMFSVVVPDIGIQP